MADEALGNFKVWHLKLTVKDGVDVAYPIVEFWIDFQATGNDPQAPGFRPLGPH